MQFAALICWIQSEKQMEKVQQNTFSYGSFSEVYYKTNEQEGFGTRYELSSIPGHTV